ncbi:hypothetical protein G195_004859 [Phytophthora kernoviae 00238/432]|uniref:Uncharacterized protein n=1 Tax=Phytophthora kernoviae 00238/432 TaxID=1284355 RepID=A0A8J4SAH8_9STRA|nr:hypothetical protein G195_004859 [Phytophthora kernoviae 00238/432]
MFGSTVLVPNLFGVDPITFRGFPKIIHILIGIVSGYVLGYFMGEVKTENIANADFISLPTVTTPTFDWSVIFTILPVALVVIVEHIGHLLVTSSIVGKDLSKDPGLHRSLLGNGVSTILSGFVGSTPNTTYGENIGVMALTRVYSTYVIGGAAVIAIVLSFSASGLRILVEQKVDFAKPTNLLLTTLVLVIGLSGTEITFYGIHLKGMALATIVGILLSLLFKLFEVLGWSNDQTEKQPLTEKTPD